METIQRPPSVEFIMCQGIDGSVYTDEFSPGERSISPPYSVAEAAERTMSPPYSVAEAAEPAERSLKRPKPSYPEKECIICYKTRQCRIFMFFPCGHSACDICFDQLDSCYYRCDTAALSAALS